MTSANPRLGVKCFICDKQSTLECELADGKASPARAQRWASRVRMAMMWPIALLSGSGRSRLRRG